MAMRKAIFISLLFLMAAIMVVKGRDIVENRLYDSMKQTLLAHGFTDTKIGNMTYDGDWLVFNDIVLDKEGFSTIDAISARTDYKDVLFGSQTDYITIDNVKLSGDFSTDTGLDIYGWKKTPLPLLHYNDILLNGAQLDLMTSTGALRIQAKGIGKRPADGTLAVKGLIWSLQNQLKFETKWNGHIYPDGRWASSVEIADAGLNFDKIQTSRMNGWMTIDRTHSVIPQISGQIDAGKFTFGDLNFSNFRLTLNGPYNNYRLIAQGAVSAYEGMTATLDVNNTNKGPQVIASIETQYIEDLMAFLNALQNSDTEAGNFTTLLLTKGNLERLSKDISKMSYDALELEIYGPLYDLAGKIIVKSFKDGVTDQRVISLNPGELDRG